MDDFTEVTILRKKPQKINANKSNSVVNNAKRRGLDVETIQKYGAGTNKKPVTTKNTAKLDRETEELKHKKVSSDVGKAIMQGRQALGMTQKDLATKVCEKQQVISEYEAGRGIPNNVILGKIERAIGIKLRGKDCGQALNQNAKVTDNANKSKSTN